MHTTSLHAFAVCGVLALAGAGAAGCGGGDEGAEAQPPPPPPPTTGPVADATVKFPEGELTKAGDYRIPVASQAEAERFCGAARDGGWPEAWAAYQEVRFSFPGPDLYCVPD
jgi:hypothetical protein